MLLIDMTYYIITNINNAMDTKRDYRANVPPNPLSLQETMTLCRYFKHKMYSRSTYT